MGVERSGYSKGGGLVQNCRLSHTFLYNKVCKRVKFPIFELIIKFELAPLFHLGLEENVLYITIYVKFVNC